MLNADIVALIMPAGWSDWQSVSQLRLLTATYAEFRSRGPGENPTAREPYSKQLTKAEAKKYETKALPGG